MIYYQDDARIGTEGTAVPGEYSTDLQTHLTVGKPNYGEKYYGRFKMDELAIYYKALSTSEITNLFDGKAIDGKVFIQFFFPFTFNIYNLLRARQLITAW